jgi:folate-binding protein YgfZ
MTMPSIALDISGVVELTHLGVIRVTGEEAVKFLQSQLTQDIALLALSEAHLAAFCNAKGRMQASFIVFKRIQGSEEEVLLVCSRDLLATTLKRLLMFVMRAKVKLIDASDDFTLYGMAGNAIELIAKDTCPAWTKADVGDGNLVYLYPGADVARALWCLPASSSIPGGPSIALTLWHWLDVQSGIAMITQPIFEAFVPQMLNYESVGGVSFKKGCYPGQEVVARSQFRGTLKRRAYVAHTQGTPVVGQEVFQARDTEQPCGLVAACASNPSGGFDAIVSMQTSAAADSADGRLSLGSSSGASLTLLPLPYPLLQDI